MSIYFDVMIGNERKAIVSIRQIAFPDKSSQTYGYEIQETGPLKRGVVEHYGPEDLSLVAAVLQDYIKGRV